VPVYPKRDHRCHETEAKSIGQWRLSLKATMLLMSLEALTDSQTSTDVASDKQGCRRRPFQYRRLCEIAKLGIGRVAHMVNWRRIAGSATP